MLPENMGKHLPLNAVTGVQRFDGRDIGQAPHIAVLGSCKLGNFVGDAVKGRDVPWIRAS